MPASLYSTEMGTSPDEDTAITNAFKMVANMLYPLSAD